MTFAKAAFARVLLKALAGEKLEHKPITLQAQDPNSKTAGALSMAGSAAKAVGNGVNHVWQKSMKQNGAVMGTVGLGLGAAGMYALGKNAINKTRASYQGFDPNVQAYTRQSPY